MGMKMVWSLPSDGSRPGSWVGGRGSMGSNRTGPVTKGRFKQGTLEVRRRDENLVQRLQAARGAASAEGDTEPLWLVKG